MDDQPQPDAWPAPDAIFAAGRAAGASIADAALALQERVKAAPSLTVSLGGSVNIDLYEDGVTLGGQSGGLGADLRPDRLSCIAGFLMGVSDAYRQRGEG